MYIILINKKLANKKIFATVSDGRNYAINYMDHSQNIEIVKLGRPTLYDV
jgi:hypothetical protein